MQCQAAGGRISIATLHSHSVYIVQEHSPAARYSLYVHCTGFETSRESPPKNCTEGFVFRLHIGKRYFLGIIWTVPTIKTFAPLGISLSPLCCPISVLGHWMGTIWSKNRWRSIFSSYHRRCRHFLLDKQMGRIGLASLSLCFLALEVTLFPRGLLCWDPIWR